MTGKSPDQPQSIDPKLQNVHVLLAVQTIVVILVSINRLSTLTLSYVAANEFLRWVDLINMLILPIISVIAFYLLKKELEKNRISGNERTHLLLNLLFIVGIYRGLSGDGGSQIPACVKK